MTISPEVSEVTSLPASELLGVLNCRSTSRAGLGHCCRYERVLRIPVAGDVVVERRSQISLHFGVGGCCFRMVAQIVTKQKTVLPSGIVSLQNMEVVSPWPGQSLPEEELARQPGLVLR